MTSKEFDMQMILLGFIKSDYKNTPKTITWWELTPNSLVRVRTLHNRSSFSIYLENFTVQDIRSRTKTIKILQANM